jgi:hypothetical protein
MLHSSYHEINLPQSLLLHDPRSPRLRQYTIINQHPRTRFQRRNQCSQDLDCILIGPVVHAPANEIHISLHILLCEEIVDLERDAGLKRFGDGGDVLGRYHGGEFLYDEFDLGECGGDGEGGVALGAAHLGLLVLEKRRTDG